MASRSPWPNTPGPSVPDFNPRGCQKGAVRRQDEPAGARDPPLEADRRAGRGRVAGGHLGQSATDIADRMLDVLVRDGPEALVFDGNATGLAPPPLFTASLPVGRYNPGPQHRGRRRAAGRRGTFGTPIACRSADDYFNSDLILIWGGNPAYTQIPNFTSSPRTLQRTRIIAISPDHNASAVHADRWISVRPGTDAALALAMSQVVISEGLHDAAFVREQTDLPLLVRRDSGRFLREADLKRGGKEDVFFVDKQTKKPAKAPRRTLRLGKLLRPSRARSKCRRWRDRCGLSPSSRCQGTPRSGDTPEIASRVCDVHPDDIRNLARDMRGPERFLPWPALRFRSTTTAT